MNIHDNSINKNRKLDLSETGSKLIRSRTRNPFPWCLYIVQWKVNGTINPFPKKSIPQINPFPQTLGEMVTSGSFWKEKEIEIHFPACLYIVQWKVPPNFYEGKIWRMDSFMRAPREYKLIQHSARDVLSESFPGDIFIKHHYKDVWCNISNEMLHHFMLMEHVL